VYVPLSVLHLCMLYWMYVPWTTSGGWRGGGEGRGDSTRCMCLVCFWHRPSGVLYWMHAAQVQVCTVSMLGWCLKKAP
jgi:hypothetical protein